MILIENNNLYFVSININDDNNLDKYTDLRVQMLRHYIIDGNNLNKKPTYKKKSIKENEFLNENSILNYSNENIKITNYILINQNTGRQIKKNKYSCNDFLKYITTNIISI